MKTLLYASPSAEQRHRVRDLRAKVSGQWTIICEELPRLREVTLTPDITWVNFGSLPSGEPPSEVLLDLKRLQSRSPQPALIVVSGQMPAATQKNFFEHLFTEVRPQGVTFDEVGLPNRSELVFFESKLDALRNQPSGSTSATSIALPATADLRETSGKLSAKRIAEVFDVTLTQLAGWLRRSKQALSKTPDADSMQPLLAHFEQIAAIRPALGDDAAFRKWLRSPHRLLQNNSPLNWIERGRVRAVAELVEDMLTGSPA